jgi:hypothetical protein
MDIYLEKYEPVNDSVLFGIGGSIKIVILKRNSRRFEVNEFEIDNNITMTFRTKLFITLLNCC